MYPKKTLGIVVRKILPAFCTRIDGMIINIDIMREQRILRGVSVNRVQTIVMAGGAGERLQPLTRGRSKASVPFGGKYLIADFTLSNCINSGVRQISVLTQYLSDSLHKHIQNGWGISGSRLGDYIYCVPAQQKVGTDWYRGTVDAIRQNLDLIKGRAGDPVLILSGDHIYKMNYRQIVDYHEMKKADITISAVRVRPEEAAGRLGVLDEDQDHRVVGFHEKPPQPETIAGAPEHVLGSMGVYVFSAGVLRETLQEPEDDFGRGAIPKAISQGRNIFAYDYEKENKIEDFVVEVKEGTRYKILVDRTHDSSYWKDIGSIDSYYEASMDLVSVDPPFNLYGEQWPFRAYDRSLPPSKFIFGEESIIFDDVNIEPGARIKRAIIDTGVRIKSGVSIGDDLEADARKGFTISDKGIRINDLFNVVQKSLAYQADQSCARHLSSGRCQNGSASL
jgi:glucose-1-phosphate adenylyltransferase